MLPPGPPEVARRLLILLAIKSHALRAMMVWDFVFRTRHAFKHLTGQTPTWKAVGLRFAWLRSKARWNWWQERRAVRRFLDHHQLTSHLTAEEDQFLDLGLSETTRSKANQLLWQTEAAACLAWALHLLPRLWPMDEQFDGKLDLITLAEPERRLIEIATLRPPPEVEAARAQAELWHWRARQLALERSGQPWPPPAATPEAVADLQSRGLDSFDGIVRATARTLREQGQLAATMDDDFVARGKAYRLLSDDEAAELRAVASERHKALNWLGGLAPGNDWADVPQET